MNFIRLKVAFACIICLVEANDSPLLSCESKIGKSDENNCTVEAFHKWKIALNADNATILSVCCAEWFKLDCVQKDVNKKCNEEEKKAFEERKTQLIHKHESLECVNYRYNSSDCVTGSSNNAIKLYNYHFIHLILLIILFKISN
jgi:hypothetical protein